MAMKFQKRSSFSSRIQKRSVRLDHCKSLCHARALLIVSGRHVCVVFVAISFPFLLPRSIHMDMSCSIHLSVHSTPEICVMGSFNGTNNVTCSNCCIVVLLLQVVLVVEGVKASTSTSAEYDRYEDG